MKNKSFDVFDPVFTGLLAAAAILCAMEMLIIVGVILFYIPFTPDPSLRDIFFHYRKGYVPEQELLLYGVGITMAAVFFVSAAVVFARRVSDGLFRRSLMRYAAVHAAVVIMLAACVFKLIVTPSDGIVWACLYTMLGVSLGLNIFWSEIDQWFGRTL